MCTSIKDVDVIVEVNDKWSDKREMRIINSKCNFVSGLLLFDQQNQVPASIFIDTIKTIILN